MVSRVPRPKEGRKASKAKEVSRFKCSWTQWGRVRRGAQTLWMATCCIVGSARKRKWALGRSRAKGGRQEVARKLSRESWSCFECAATLLMNGGSGRQWSRIAMPQSRAAVLVGMRCSYPQCFAQKNGGRRGQIGEAGAGGRRDVMGRVQMGIEMTRNWT